MKEYGVSGLLGFYRCRRHCGCLRMLMDVETLSLRKEGLVSSTLGSPTPLLDNKIKDRQDDGEPESTPVSVFLTNHLILLISGLKGQSRYFSPRDPWFFMTPLKSSPFPTLSLWYFKKYLTT